MKILMDDKNHGAGKSGSRVCSINKVSCWNYKCDCHGTLVCVQEL